MLFVAFLFLITLSAAKSDKDFETRCKNDYRDLISNTPIDVMKYCTNNLCIEKCCAAGEIMRIKKNTCGKVKEIFKTIPNLEKLKLKINYSTNILSSRDENKESIHNFTLVHNNRDTFKCTELPSTDFCEYDILKDGSINWQDNESKKWNRIEKLDYCIDYKLVIFNKVPDIKIIIRGVTRANADRKQIETFEIVAILISSFFLMLVLVVYCLLPDLRNLSGLVLMAYTFSLLFAFINKVILTFIKRNPPEGFCKKYTPVVYFAFMACMFWLSVLSFEVWSGLRAFRIKQRSKRADLIKFMWYNLYAWGSPLVITAIVTALDNIVGLDIIEPPFKDCFMDGKSYDYYFKIPIGVLISIDIVLFFMTAYHIWIVRRAINQHQDSKNSNQRNKTASTYAKLSVMMGVSWSLELLPATDFIWVYILINLYNLLTGVAIFYWFVCDKKVLMPLCKKFNIQNKFTKKWEAELSQPTKSGTTRSTGASSSIVKNRPKDENEETDLMKNCPKEEIIII